MPLRALHRCQRGFTSLALMGVLAVGGLLVAASFAAVDPDISMSREDQDQKQAYGAAEAGLQWYLNRLGQDNSFYLRCSNVPRPNPTELAPVNQAWNGAGADPRIWRRLPGEQAEYTVELLPAPGFAQCVEGNQYSVVDPDGNLRVRVTGRSRAEVRTVLATLRRSNFIDFIYFTHFETLDPAAYSTASAIARATTECSRFRSLRTSFCTEITFISADDVRGPLHTNDNLRICGSPTLGRTRRDAVEITGSPRWVNGGCGAAPDVQGTLVHPADQLGMPPSNSALASIAELDYKRYGRTEIRLNGSTVTITGARTPGGIVTTETLPLPANGVIYVHSGGSCSSNFVRSQTYSGIPPACGDAWVSGTYDADLTIAAERDVVVRDDLVRGGTGVLLGLIANNFVRVYHPVTFDDDGPGGCVNRPDAPTDPRIDAAILALQHSFIVDNWYCGAPLGDLTVFGAIAQRFRGPVGTFSGSTVATGYAKQYEYNDRLRYREPPFFLDPVQASWRISRETEQVPAVR